MLNRVASSQQQHSHAFPKFASAPVSSSTIRARYPSQRATSPVGLYAVFMAPKTQQADIVIIGGGIIGCTTAYYLSRHPLYNPETTKITVLEASASGVAQGASGKAGGLSLNGRILSNLSTYRSLSTSDWQRNITESTGGVSVL